MGNESCKLKGLEVDKTAVDANDFWTLSNGISSTTTSDDGKQNLSIFQGEAVVNGQLWLCQGPLERAIRNLMIYRHPYILKYITTWEQGGQKYLATERVQPLQMVLLQQSDIQICLGLRTVLCGLIFLVEKALARHLNICTESIYVTEMGNWRLAGFEYVWKSKDLKKTLLDLAESYRYKNAIDPDESRDEKFCGIEQYAFATLCEEILSKRATSEQITVSIPHVQEFREYCSNHLKHTKPQMRPKLSAILLHPYFNHEFVLIHAFLFELPLKSNHEKQDFFMGLVDRLRYFDEDVVGAQFAGDLLSRMVLLDATAQLRVTPYVLRTKQEHNSALFSADCFTKYLLPIILKMFRLRDAQIRLILLEYFMDYVSLLKPQAVEKYILPHLKVGINDTNELLVAKTLCSLADLVPILGATTVLGVERVKLFSDGRPQAAVSDTSTHWTEPRSISPVLGENDDCPIVSGSPLPECLYSKSGSFSSISQALVSESYEHCMPQRLSPDGGEDVKSPSNLDFTNKPLPVTPTKTELRLKAIQNIIDDGLNATTNNKENDVRDKEQEEEVWSDWDNEDSTKHIMVDTSHSQLLALGNKKHNILQLASDDASDQKSCLVTGNSSHALPPQTSLSDSYAPSSQTSLRPIKALNVTPINDDFSDLDIQVKQSLTFKNITPNELDFFKDMEPVIKSCQKHDSQMTEQQGKAQDLTVATTTQWWDTNDIIVDRKRFAAPFVNDDNGWGVEDYVGDLNISSSNV